MRWGTQPRWARWVAAMYVIGFVEGTGSHAYDVIRGGLHAYHYWPLPSQLLFHALLVLDLLVAVWVVLAHPAGPPLGAAIMAADLAANWWGNWEGILGDPFDYVRLSGLAPITLFGIFVLATALPLRRTFRQGLSRQGLSPNARYR
ncbi:hypothetical protein [Streptomyces griseoluteus]|uniref:hypothetical protein n=1 Tax=Streptomyces griseoluteus TaxID=29306 RepID=UPI003431F7EB